MIVDYEKRFFLPWEKVISYDKQEDDRHIYLDLCLYSDRFIEYQKNLFSDFYSTILDAFEKNEIFLDFKRILEEKIKQFNTQLKIFQEKTNLDTKIEIRWNLQVVWWSYYMSTLIWESSIIIFRDRKLEVVVPNEVEETDKIDIFSEIIEWELENGDSIISLWCNIYNYLSDNEIKDLVSTGDIASSLEEILKVRISDKEIAFIDYLSIKIDKIVVNVKKEFNLQNYKDFFQKYRYAIWLMLWVLIIFFVVISIFLYLWKDDDKQVIQIAWKTQEVDLEWLKRQIDTFTRLDAKDIDLKKQQYEKIMEELSAYEKSGIQQLEIRELKKKMKQNYYRWFNINIVSDTDGLLQPIYTFSDKEKQSLENVLWLTKNRSYINVYWKKWVLLSIINTKTKAILQTLNLPTNVKTCKTNLSVNWLYCILENNDIYNFSKYGIKSITNDTWYWPKSIDLWTYGVNKLYLLTLDPKLNNKKIYIQRYMIKWKNQFRKPTNYIFAKDADMNLASFIYTWSTFDIDGSFPVWWKHKLLQIYRKSNYSNELEIREIKWWEKAIIDEKNDFSWKVKVISNVGSKYLYLYDYSTNSLVVYYSANKTSDAGRNKYIPVYLYKVQFMLDEEKVKDVIVDEKAGSRNKFVYVLTDKWIYKLDLAQFR